MQGSVLRTFFWTINKTARTFVSTQLKSENLRHRYNAAEAVRLYLAYGGKGPASKWGVTTLVELLTDGSIDGSGVSGSPPGEFPLGDRHDIMHTPIDSICASLGYRKAKTAVPALISVLERRPQTSSAAYALGEIGDEQAIPILLKVLNDKTGTADFEVTALAKLKCKQAVPILISKLGRPGVGQFEDRKAPRSTVGKSETTEQSSRSKNIYLVITPKNLKPLLNGFWCN